MRMTVDKARNGKPVLSVDYLVGRKTFRLSANGNYLISFYINTGFPDYVLVSFRQYCHNIF